MDRQLHGIIVPMITLLLAPDQPDVEGLERLIEHILSGGVHGLFVLGSTGEGPALSYSLRRTVIQHVCKQVANRVPVLVGALDTAYTEMVNLACFAADAGTHGIVTAPPYYFALSEGDILRHVQQFAQDSPLPLYVYNVPNSKLPRFSLATLEKVMEVQNVRGFKDSSGDLSYLRDALRILSVTPGFRVLVGPEELLAASLREGAHGGMNGGANIFPGLYVALYNACLGNQMAEISRLQHCVETIRTRFYSHGELESSLIRGLQTCASVLGICSDTMTLPYTSATAEQRTKIQKEIEEFECVFAVHGV